MLRKLSSFAVAVLLVSACAERERHTTDLSYDASQTGSVKEKLAALTTSLSEAQAQNVPLLSPRWFESAQQSATDAAAAVAAGDSESALREIADGESQLKQAKQFSTEAREKLSDTIKARNEAARSRIDNSRALVANKVAQDLSPADQYLRELTAKLENGEAVDAEKDKATKNYQALKVAVSPRAVSAPTAASSPNYASSLKSRFTENEADVIQNGSQMTLRLKSVQFAPGQSSLNNQNLDVLKKVSQIVSEFPSAQVRVEGHTDATGSAALNTKLSQARADAVKTYLIESGAIAAEKITSVGRGSEVPVAQGNSKAARAKNRRIDVVIDGLPSSPIAE